MIRKIIHIDEDKCNGCGLCATACHEGAIDIVDGKARLAREHFCDGFGDCLPNCPTGAITFEEREAPEYDEAAVKEAQRAKKEQNAAGNGACAEANTEGNQMEGMQLTEEQRRMMAEMGHHPGGGCPGSRYMQLQRSEEAEEQNTGAPQVQAAMRYQPVPRLAQWPCQIKLVPTQAPFYEGARLLIAADCTAYAYANMHEEFMKGNVTLIGCPKLDDVDYSDKLTEIIANNDIKSVTIVRMEVPCCGGLQRAAENALRASGKFIPWQVVTISRDGRILD